MSSEVKMATCHPDKKAVAKGLCSSCYRKSRLEAAAKAAEPEVIDNSVKDGWFAITKDFKILRESEGITKDNPGGGRPVALGNEDGLRVCGASAYGHTVAIDLINGVIALDFDNLGIQNETIEINPKVAFSICEETNVVGEFKHRKTTKPKKNGDYLITYEDMIFRPIWFNRIISTLPGPVVVIGAQTTTPREQGKRNIKKIISLFPDGRIGIS